jgi:large subunit ribosomal protein L34
MPKRTYQPKKRKRAREHGFLKRMSSKAGKRVLNRRRTKSRAKISA